MALKKRYASTAEIPEAHRSLYKKEGSGWLLDLEADADDDGSPEQPPADEGAAAKKLREFRQENIRLRKETERLSAELGKYDPEAYESAMKAAESARNEEERALLQKGKFDEVMNRRLKSLQDDRAKAEQQYKEQLAQQEQSAHNLRTKLHRTRVQAMLREEADRMKVQLLPTAVDDFYSRGLNVFNAIDDDGEPVALDGDDVRFNKEQKPYSPKDFILELMESAPHLIAGASGADTGSPGSRTRPRSAGIVDIDPNDPRSMGNNVDRIAGGKLNVRVVGQ